MVDLLLIVPIAGLAAFAFAAYLTRDVLSRDKGTPKMQEIAAAIQEGARAFMKRQYTAIAILAAVFAVIFAVALGVTQSWVTGLKTAGAFALGATFSAASGYIGMHIAIVAMSLLGVTFLYFTYAAVTPVVDYAGVPKFQACMASFNNDTAVCTAR